MHDVDFLDANIEEQFTNRSFQRIIQHPPFLQKRKKKEKIHYINSPSQIRVYVYGQIGGSGR